MATNNTFHLSKVAAETFKRQRLPEIFAPIAKATLDAISLPSSDTLLDVACGTGVMARAVGTRLTAPYRIVGCDLNPAMIEVARKNILESGHRFAWIEAPADAMPLGDGEVDLAFLPARLAILPGQVCSPSRDETDPAGWCDRFDLVGDTCGGRTFSGRPVTCDAAGSIPD